MKKIAWILMLAVAGVWAQGGKVKLHAKIENRNGDVITVQGKNFKHEIKADAKGEFKDTFEITKGFYDIFDGVEYAQAYLAPGFDLTLKMDAKQFDESIVWSGKGADENNFLAAQVLADEKLENMASADEETVKTAVFDRIKADKEMLAKGNFDTDFKNRMERQSQGSAMGALAQYYQNQKTMKLQGQPSPSFAYENHKGGKTTLEDLRGKYVYIDAWATWCGPCIREIPAMKEVEKKYHGKNIEFVSISIDEKKDYEKWKKFVKDKEMGGIQLYADNAWNSDFMVAYGVKSIPRFILIGPDGKVISADAPRPSSPELVSQLDKLLN